MGTPLILASSSPRRYELLKQINLDFEVNPSNLEEKVNEYMSPEQMAMKFARQKSLEVASRLQKGIVIGADTLVVLNDTVLEKPKSEVEAKEMLFQLSGSIHKVITAISLVNAFDDRELTDWMETKVWFKKVEEKEIDRYISTGEPMDKAGAYGIQGFGSLFVEKIEGCYYNVVGLSLFLLGRMMEAFGVKI